MRLKSFVHISDLHFGLIKPPSKDAPTPLLWATCGLFDGLLGHSYRSLVHLDQFFGDLRQLEQAELIVTGDLTTVCHDKEFATAVRFLSSELKPPEGDHVGLNVRDWSKFAVPGNHDHWCGARTMVGRPGPALNRHFRKLPFMRDPIELATGQTLRFLGIDTDGDVWPFGSDRVLARGSFLSQLTTLEQNLDVLGEREIRVLLLHHSRAARGAKLSINKSSLSALDDFIVKNGISVLLCGHVHQPPKVDTFALPTFKAQFFCTEARCGTTTQLSTIPYAWRNLRRDGASPDSWPNTLLVHRVVGTEDDIWWETSVYAERLRGFELITESEVPELAPQVVHIWPS